MARSAASASRALSANPLNTFTRATAPTIQLEARLFHAPPFSSQPPCADTCGRNAARAAVWLARASCSWRSASVTSGRFLIASASSRCEIGGVDDGDRRSRLEQERLAEWRAHQLIEPRAGDALIGRGDNLLFARARQVHVDLQDVRVGDEPRIPAVASELPIRTRRFHRRVGRLACTGGGEHTSVRVGHARGQVMVHHLPSGTRHLVTDAGDGDVGPRDTIEQRLFDRHGGAKVVEGVGVIERAEGEVGGGELPLGQQRAEDEDRLIAALPRLGDVHLGPVARACLSDALCRLALRRSAAAGIRVLRAGTRDGVGQCQLGLGGGRNWQSEGDQEEVSRRDTSHVDHNEARKSPRLVRARAAAKGSASRAAGDMATTFVPGAADPVR